MIAIITLLLFAAQSQSANISECCCSTETVDLANNELLYNVLTKLRRTTFFKIFKVSLEKECQFWDAAGVCGKDTCSVCYCGEDEIPEPWRAETNITSGDAPPGFDAEGFKTVDREIDEKHFLKWQQADDMWIVHDETENEQLYINLEINPEGYTGYGGFQAWRVWAAIYKENCFGAGEDKLDSMCMEERVFYRIISGFHAATNMGIASHFPLPNGQEGPNLELFQRSVGNFASRVDNLYFDFVFLLRAVNKVRDVLASYDYNTGNPVEDRKTARLVQELLSHPIIQSCPRTELFDETLMFDGNPLHPRIPQFKEKFRNISSIIDCVECEKCKLYSKIQILGLGTALKILFSPEVVLQRNEVISLVLTLGKFSENIKFLHQFRRMERLPNIGRHVVSGLFLLMGIMIVYLCFLRCRRSRYINKKHVD